MMNHPADAPEPAPGATPRGRKRILIWTAGIILSLAVLSIALPLGALKYSEAKAFDAMSAEHRAKFHAWYTEKLTLPADELALSPFSRELQKAVLDFRQIWETHKSDALNFDQTWAQGAYAAGSGIDPAFIERSRKHVQSAAPFIAAFKHVVNQPDYTINAWNSIPEGYAYSHHKYDSIRCATRLVYTSALIHAKDSRLPAAINDADALLAYGTMSPYFTIVEKMVALAGVEYALEACQAVLAHSPQLAIKEDMFHMLWRRLPAIKFYPDLSQVPLVLDHIGSTAAARRAGLPANFQDKTGYEIMAESLRVRTDYLKQIALPAATSPKEKQDIQAAIDSLDQAESTIEKAISMVDHYREASQKVTAATLYSVAAKALERADDNARETFEQYNKLLKTVSRRY